MLGNSVDEQVRAFHGASWPAFAHPLAAMFRVAWSGQLAPLTKLVARIPSSRPGGGRRTADPRCRASGFTGRWNDRVVMMVLALRPYQPSARSIHQPAVLP